jgi:murein DD-endopeptidase MepM/ murein hydrolase activator NlpD
VELWSERAVAHHTIEAVVMLPAIVALFTVTLACGYPKADVQPSHLANLVNQASEKSRDGGCPKRRILNTHSPDVGGHRGVDFVVCPGESIVAISDGIVVGVGKEVATETGNLLLIMHDLGGGRMHMYEYVHLVHIRRKDGEQVKRGQVLGDPWVPNDGTNWTPHVHLQYLGDAPAELHDPLRWMKGCPSRFHSGITYPVSC